MTAVHKIGAAALGAALAGTVLVPTGASAQEACDPEAYPPQQCTVNGGNSFGAPPILVNKTKLEPGEAIEIELQAGCVPGTEVFVALVRVSGGSVPVGLTTTEADAGGGYGTTVTVPADSANGVYVLFSQCEVSPGVVAVSTATIVIAGRTGGAPAGQGSSRTTSVTPAAPSTASKTAAAITAADVAAMPARWEASPAWTADASTKAAVTEAVNLRLAALRTALPAADVPAPAVTSVPTATDLTPWFAAGGAALLVLGAAGYRRRSATTGHDEVSA